MSNRGVYSIRGSFAVTAAQTLLQIKSGASSPLELLRASITQSSSETSDTSEGQILRKSVAATVTSHTPKLWHPNDQAAKAVGGTAATGINASAEGTDGDILVGEGFNLLAGWTWLATPDEQIFVDPGGILAIKLAVAIASATVVSLMVFKELG